MALKVRNIMADGTVRDSMKGVVVPADCEVYAVLAEIIRRKKNEQMDNRGQECFVCWSR